MPPEMGAFSFWENSDSRFCLPCIGVYCYQQVRERERNPEMMNLNDFQNAINDYLTNCDQNPEDWDVWGTAIQLRDEYPNAESIDDIDPDDFNDALKNHEN